MMARLKAWMRAASLRGTDRRPHITFYLTSLLTGVLAGLTCDWRSASTPRAVILGAVMATVLIAPSLTALREVIDEQSGEIGGQKAAIPKAKASNLTPLHLAINWLVLVAGIILTTVLVWQLLVGSHRG
jgi:hypothetical protein